MIESRPIPAIAVSAVSFATAEHMRNLQQLAQQTAEVMALPASEHWNISFDTGFATRDVPDAPQGPSIPPNSAPAAA